jgi:hypothetical protein
MVPALAAAKNGSFLLLSVTRIQKAECSYGVLRCGEIIVKIAGGRMQGRVCCPESAHVETELIELRFA